jgi:hypothetical protein
MMERICQDRSQEAAMVLLIATSRQQGLTFRSERAIMIADFVTTASVMLGWSRDSYVLWCLWWSACGHLNLLGPP